MKSIAHAGVEMEMEPRVASQQKFDVFVGATKVKPKSVAFKDGNISVERPMIGNLFAEAFKSGQKVTLTLVPCYYLPEKSDFLDMPKIQFLCQPIDYVANFTAEALSDVPVDEKLVLKILRETKDEVSGSS